MSAVPLLAIEGLTKRFGGVTALDGVSLQVARGEIVSLIGPNGAGKTTLFNCVTGLLRPEAGSVWFGREGRIALTGLAPHEIVECGVARTFQNIRLFSSMSVLENVMAATYLRTRAGVIEAGLLTPGARREERWARERAMELLESVELGDRAQEEASTLPFGLQRRLEIARAQATEPALLLLDEPAAGLNPVEKQQLVRMIGRLKAQGITILLIEHDMQVVMPISDRIAVLDYGRKIAEGVPAAIREDARVVEAYLGVQQG